MSKHKVPRGEKKLASLSIFYPCFNEEKSIPLFIEEALDVFPKLAQKFELIIIDDGSTDGTVAVSNKLAKKHKNVRLVSHSENLGYGAALRTGFKSARHKWIFFTDGDLQFKQSQLGKFLEFTNDFDVLIGYRVNRAEGKMRAFNAWLFKLYIDLLFRLGVKDIDCAFKLLKRKAIQAIQLESTGAFTSAELLYKLKKKKVGFKQLPVRHRKRKFGDSTGNNPRVVIKAAIEALSLYLKIKIGSLAK